MKVVLYSGKDCSSCARLREELIGMGEEVGFVFEEVNLEEGSALSAPAVVINDWLRLTEIEDAARLRLALEKMKAREKAKPALSGCTRELVIALDRFIYRLSKHWLLLFNLAAGIYAGLPILAPLLEWKGVTFLSRAIYFIYSYFCHQSPSRSFFIFGYQMAYCQRDTAIYTSILAAGLVFALARKKVRPLSPRKMLLGLVLVSAPMVIDGGTQLFLVRESNWWLRTITGALFGAGSTWLVYPYIEQGMLEARQMLESKPSLGISR